MPHITIKFGDSDVSPPVFVAGSFTDWQPVELEPEKGDTSGPFSKTFTVKPGKYQYKFRLGTGDWWVCDQNADRANDESGNENNILEVSSESVDSSQQNNNGKDGESLTILQNGPIQHTIEDGIGQETYQHMRSESSQTERQEHLTTNTNGSLKARNDAEKAPQGIKTENVTPTANGDVKAAQNKQVSSQNTSKSHVDAKMGSHGHNSGSASSSKNEKSTDVPPLPISNGTTSLNSVLFAAVVALALPVFVSWIWSK